ncbi:MAG: hypothetical protein AABZ60_10785 [Planctomycetota bacterium]
MFSENPFALSVFLQFSSMIFLSGFYFWRKPKAKRTLFAMGWSILGLRISMDIFFWPYAFFGPKGFWILTLLSIFAFLPLPELLGKRSSGRILSAVFAVILFFFLTFDSFYYLFKGAEMSKLNGVRGSNTLVIFQSTPYTCVPACVASLMTDLGYPMSEGSVAVQLFTSHRGTYTTKILYFLKNHEAKLHLQNLDFEAVNWNEPWISLVTVRVKPKGNPSGNDIAHMVLVYPDPEGTLSVGDPLENYSQNFTVDLFKIRYRPTGTVLQIQRSDGTIPEVPKKVKERE